MRSLVSLLLIGLFPSGFAMGQVKDKARLYAPDFYTFQYAGSIGFGSTGLGYDFFKEKVSVSLMYGYVPERFGGELNAVTLKYVYKPFVLKTKSLEWKPVNPGIFVSNTFGKGFSFTWPDDKYPKSYYWWSPSLRVHPSLSTELKFPLKGNLKSLSLYAEINTNDLYLFSYFANTSWLSPYKIFKSGYGLQLRF